MTGPRRHSQTTARESRWQTEEDVLVLHCICHLLLRVGGLGGLGKLCAGLRAYGLRLNPNPPLLAVALERSESEHHCFLSIADMASIAYQSRFCRMLQISLLLYSSIESRPSPTLLVARYSILLSGDTSSIGSSNEGQLRKVFRVVDTQGKH